MTARDDHEERYTKPELRERLKKRLKRSSKGGRKGQWSARKSQLLVQHYDKAGGGYRGEKKGRRAKSLQRWTEQYWQTKGGKGKARRGGAMQRYLPKAVWERLTPAQQRAAERKKRRADERGEQRAVWTPAVRRAMREVANGEDGGRSPTKRELYRKAQRLGIDGRSKMDKAQLARAVRKAER